MNERKFDCWECLRQRHDGSELKVHIQPRSSHTRIVGLLGERVKIQLSSPAVEGRANAALEELLARQFRVPKHQIHILSGLRSKKKTVLIKDKTIQEIHAILCNL